MKAIPSGTSRPITMLVPCLLLLAAVPSCAGEKDEPGVEYCTVPLECPDVPHIDCMPNPMVPSPDVCIDTACMEWMIANCTVVISV